jgi:hypothetical protein
MAMSALNMKPGTSFVGWAKRSVPISRALHTTVIPAHPLKGTSAGIQKPLISLSPLHWTPAFAGVTACFSIC